MARALRSVPTLAPAVLALLLIGPGAAAVARLADDPAALRLVDALRALAIAAPLLAAVLAACFHQCRLALAGLVGAGLAALLAAQPLLLEGPGRPAILVGLALALGLGSRLPERGATSSVGTRSLGLALTLASLPVLLAAVAADDLALALQRLGAAVQPSPGLGVPWLGLAGLVVAVVACWHAPGRDGDLVGPALAASLATQALALWLSAPLPSALALLGGAATLLAVVPRIAWRRGFVDDLTRLPGRRALDVALDGLSGAHAIAVIDVDHFKRFNDEHGHDAGDDALRIVARVLRGLRGGTAYRQGGEEFVAIFKGAGAAEAAEALEELRAAIESTPLLVRGRAGAKRKALRVTASIGVAQRTESLASSRAVLRAADQALLRAKRAGRNRVEVERRRATRVA